MKFDFVGRCNKLIPNTIVLDEAANKWRVLLGGILKVDVYDTMAEAALAVDRVVNRSDDWFKESCNKSIFDGITQAKLDRASPEEWSKIIKESCNKSDCMVETPKNTNTFPADWSKKHTPSFPAVPPSPEEWITAMLVHPTIVKNYLTNSDGTLRIPSREEWTEDYGLGYANRLAWEGTGTIKLKI